MGKGEKVARGRGGSEEEEGRECVGSEVLSSALVYREYNIPLQGVQYPTRIRM